MIIKHLHHGYTSSIDLQIDGVWNFTKAYALPAFVQG